MAKRYTYSKKNDALVILGAIAAVILGIAVATVVGIAISAGVAHTTWLTEGQNFLWTLQGVFAK